MNLVQIESGSWIVQISFVCFLYTSDELITENKKKFMNTRSSNENNSYFHIELCKTNFGCLMTFSEVKI